MTAISLTRNNQKAYDSISDDLKQVINQSNYDETLAQISKKHKLHIDQSAKLEALLSKIVFGEVNSADIINKIEEEVQISKSEAIEISKDINELIIHPIKDSLRQLQTQELPQE